MPSTITPQKAPERTLLTGGSWLADASAIQGASGIASGTVSGATEDWCRTTQSMTFNYVRVPQYTSQAALDVIGLTQLSAVDNVSNTRMHTVATLTSKQEKIYLPVGTSGYTQFQKFALEPLSSDIYGTTYGVVSGYVMGPQGRIITTQPYIKTEKWSDAIHTVHDYSETGTTDVCIVASSIEYKNGANLQDPYSKYVLMRSFWKNLEVNYDPAWAGNHKYLIWSLNSKNFVYSLNGAYLTTAEVAWENEAQGRTKLINYIEDVCDAFTSSNWNNRLAISKPLHSNGNYFPVESDRVPQNTYYYTGWHDYT
mgnify:CR=1 FL=1